jgi:hypothetical protein
MKGISPILSSILILGIYASLIFMTYNFGNPIVEKNIDITILQKAEDFLYKLARKINEVRTLGIKKEIIFDLPGEIVVDAQYDKIYYQLKRSTSLYKAQNFTCLSKSCNLTLGTLGEDNFLILKAKTYKFEDKFISFYFLETRNLTDGKNIYKIDLITPGNVTLAGKEKAKLIIKSTGTEIKNSGGNKIVTILIDITID